MKECTGFAPCPNFAYGKLVADFVRRFLLFLKDFTGHRLTMFCLTAKRAVSEVLSVRLFHYML